jgi:undecaprenyl-diphosphatase
MSVLTYPEAAVVGALQGFSELFPISSLGHSVLLPALVGGRWAHDLNVSRAESPYLAFIVGLHVATAAALVVFFWRDWVRIVRGLFSSIRNRQVVSADQRLAWMLVLATIPVGITGLLLEHTFRTTLSKPSATSAFLALNGLILLGAERLRRRALVTSPVVHPDQVDRLAAGGTVGGIGGAVGGTAGGGIGGATGGGIGGATGGGAVVLDERTISVQSDRSIATMPMRRAVLIGAAQIAALCPGISRSGVTMSAGLLRGLSHEDAARFSFLLATPVIAAAGLLKIPDLTGSLGQGIHGQILLGSVLSFVTAYLSVRFLTRWFQFRSLRPFGIYSLIVGIGCLLYFI